MIHASSIPYIFYTDEMPSGYEYSPKFIFNTRDYLKVHNLPDYTFYLFNTQTRQIGGMVCFFEHEGKLISPGRASFGGFEFREENEEAKAEFVEFVADTLKNKGKEIYIRCFPESYDPTNAVLIRTSLEKSGFKLLTQEPSHHISVGTEEFSSVIHQMEKRKLFSAKKNGFEFREELPVNLPSIYEFIETCRREKGQSLSMSLQQILEVSRKLPGFFRIFSVSHQDEIIAASVMVVINHDILYNFYPASSEKRKKDSPMVFLLSGAYEYCQNHGYSILDMGTSWLIDKPNESLIRFKENMGGKLSFRNSFSR